MKNDYLDQAFGLGARGAGDGRGAGTGYAIAQALGQAGAKVVVNDLSAQACDAACERLRAAGIQAQGAPFDVADGEAVAAGCASWRRPDGRPTCWSATLATRTASPWSR